MLLWLAFRRYHILQWGFIKPYNNIIVIFFYWKKNPAILHEWKSDKPVTQNTNLNPGCKSDRKNTHFLPQLCAYFTSTMQDQWLFQVSCQNKSRRTWGIIDELSWYHMYHTSYIIYKSWTGTCNSRGETVIWSVMTYTCSLSERPHQTRTGI